MELSLPTPPAIAVRILDAVRQDTSFSDLAKIISSDLALTARILQVANSSFYSMRYPVDSIERAVTVLGSEALKNIALSFIIVRALKPKTEEIFNFEFFWKRAVTAAVAGQVLATRLRLGRDDAFVLCLLQDIGVVLLNLSRPEEYRKVLRERMTDTPLEEVERQILGVDHQAIGAQALKGWGLPVSIYEPVGLKSSPQVPVEHRQSTILLRISGLVSSVYHGNPSQKRIAQLKSLLLEEFGLAEDDVEDYIDSVAEKTVEILGTFEIDGTGLKPLSQILQEANQELGKLNLTYEQLVVELKLAKEKAELFAKDLQEANRKLRDLASRDGLTGLFNHRHFQETLAAELERGLRHHRPVSLLLLDIDHFKEINDTFGHPRGDGVLQALARRGTALLRSSDILARYGGEEFAVILPETGDKGAYVLAERMRRGIEQMEIPADGLLLKVTVSIGISTWTPEIGHADKARLIEAADKALYLSKKNGRNRSWSQGLDVTMT